jgi:hypothetical protein
MRRFDRQQLCYVRIFVSDARTSALVQVTGLEPRGSSRQLGIPSWKRPAHPRPTEPRLPEGKLIARAKRKPPMAHLAPMLRHGEGPGPRNSPAGENRQDLVGIQVVLEPAGPKESVPPGRSQGQSAGRPQGPEILTLSWVSRQPRSRPGHDRQSSHETSFAKIPVPFPVCHDAVSSLPYPDSGSLPSVVDMSQSSAASPVRRGGRHGVHLARSPESPVVPGAA